MDLKEISNSPYIFLSLILLHNLFVNSDFEFRMVFENKYWIFFEESREHIEMAFTVNTLYSNIRSRNIDGASTEHFIYFGGYCFSYELNHCISISGAFIID